MTVRQTIAREIAACYRGSETRDAEDGTLMLRLPDLRMEGELLPASVGHWDEDEGLAQTMAWAFVKHNNLKPEIAALFDSSAAPPWLAEHLHK